MNTPHFTQAIASTINTNSDGLLILADDDPVKIVWGISTEPETILVTDADGAVFELTVRRLTLSEDDQNEADWQHIAGQREDHQWAK